MHGRIVLGMNILPTNIPPTVDWVDLGQADREGPFSKRTLWKLIASGQLPAFRPFKRKVLIRRSDLATLIEATRLATPVDETLTESGQGNG
jgi:excisionase family DNA binding protein